MIIINEQTEENMKLLNAWTDAVDGKGYEAYLNHTVVQDIGKANAWLNSEVSKRSQMPSTESVLASIMAKQQADSAPEAVPISEGV